MKILGHTSVVEVTTGATVGMGVGTSGGGGDKALGVTKETQRGPSGGIVGQTPEGVHGS